MKSQDDSQSEQSSRFVKYSLVRQGHSLNSTSEQGREYGCPCGKYYLSNAALYTHVKFKHNGEAPGPLIRPPDRRRKKGNFLEAEWPRQANSNANSEVKKQHKSIDSTDIQGETNKSKVHRPPHFTNKIEQDSDCPFDVAEEVSKLLLDVQVTTDFPFPSFNGTVTCQNMISKFMDQLAGISPEMLKIIRYFLNLLREHVSTQKSPDQWCRMEPNDIVLMANSFIKKFITKKQHHSQLSKDKLIDLTYLLCRWMYRKKWTTSKLIKRVQPNFVLLR